MPNPTIGVATENFGVGEALAIYLLRCVDALKDAIIVTDHSQWNACNALVGVGDRFQPTDNHFSHHGRDYNETMHTLLLLKNYNTKLSTGGQVYAIYGKHILRQRQPERYSSDNEKKLLQLDFRRIYEYFVEVMDSCIFTKPLSLPTPEK